MLENIVEVAGLSLDIFSSNCAGVSAEFLGLYKFLISLITKLPWLIFCDPISFAQKDEFFTKRFGG